MAAEFLKALLVEQRKRLVGSLMDHIEKQVYAHLPPESRTALRAKVLSSVGAYHDVVLDCLKASVSDGSVGNEAALELLERVHASQVALRRDVERWTAAGGTGAVVIGGNGMPEGYEPPSGGLG